MWHTLQGNRKILISELNQRRLWAIMHVNWKWQLFLLICLHAPKFVDTCRYSYRDMCCWKIWAKPVLKNAKRSFLVDVCGSKTFHLITPLLILFSIQDVWWIVKGIFHKSLCSSDASGLTQKSVSLHCKFPSTLQFSYFLKKKPKKQNKTCINNLGDTSWSMKLTTSYSAVCCSSTVSPVGGTFWWCRGSSV